MTDYLDLAIRYGGFTALDRVYLQGRLEGLSDDEKLAYITPPPSVLNAYFSEIYQKKSPKAATDYFFEISKQLHLFQEFPSFEEEKPFIRLNLSGKSFGFAYRNAAEEARVFGEERLAISFDILFEIAQIFPHYVVSLDEGEIVLHKFPVFETFSPCSSPYLLTDMEENAEWLKLSGVSQEEVLEAAQSYLGKRHYAWSGKTALLYIKK